MDVGVEASSTNPIRRGASSVKRSAAEASSRTTGTSAMYDIRWIRENAEAFDRGLRNRGAEPLSAMLLGVDDRARAVQ